MSYKGKRILAVIPARGGSKGISKKNLCQIAGKTLVRHAIECAQAVPMIDRIACSTDSPEIRLEALVSGATVIERPPELAVDSAGDAPVLLHAWHDEDVIVMLQPTSPIRRPEEVEAAITLLVDGDYQSVWTVSPTPLHYHPDKQLTMDDWGLFGQAAIRRQDLKQTYTRNGVAYAMTSYCLREYGTMGRKCGALILDGERVSIDEPRDLERAEWLYGGFIKA